MIDNKELVQKTKEFLTKKNIKIKTSDIYELYSFLSNENSWNVASAKQINFNEKLNINNKLNLDELLKDLKTNGPFLVEELLKSLGRFKNIEKIENEDYHYKSTVQTLMTSITNPTGPKEYHDRTILVSYFFEDPYFKFQDNPYNFELKHIQKLIYAKNDFSGDITAHGLIITSSRAIPPKWRELCRRELIEIVDLEDFKRALNHLWNTKYKN